MTETFVLVFTTMPPGEAATTLARTLVEERLAACVHLAPPMQSIYRWKGELQQDREQQLAIKTTHARLPGLEARLTELHPYEVPEFVVIAIDAASAAYGAWLQAAVADA
jgi:periplasmic divalent cation tolerance protein